MPYKLRIISDYLYRNTAAIFPETSDNWYEGLPYYRVLYYSDKSVAKYNNCKNFINHEDSCVPVQWH